MARHAAYVYYLLKPLLPRRLQVLIRRRIVLLKQKLYENVWPIDVESTKPPKDWTGWPNNKQFALILTHDVETEIGQSKCSEIIELEKKLGFRSSFNFVPEGYKVSAKLRSYLTMNGFEVGVHGLIHDNKLFKSREIFDSRAKRINAYLKEWKSVGFRSPSMHNNLEWTHDLNIEYDASTFDTDPFEPQPEGVRTIFPFWVQQEGTGRGYVELPYTLPQDFTLFIMLKQKDNNIWKEKLDWIVKNGGMALLNTHPDYMSFDGRKSGFQEYTAEYYFEFLNYIKEQYKDQYWHVLPMEIARFYKANFRI